MIICFFVLNLKKLEMQTERNTIWFRSALKGIWSYKQVMIFYGKKYYSD